MILPARLCSGDLILRPLRLRDCRRFMRLDRAAGRPASPVIPGVYSWPGLWWRLRRRLTVCYTIEVERAACGIIGFYDLTNEGSAHVAMTIYDPAARGKGIGSRAFSLLAGMLVSRPAAATLYADVADGDGLALGFWIKQGFTPLPGHAAEKTLRLRRDLKHGAPDFF